MTCDICNEKIFYKSKHKDKENTKILSLCKIHFAEKARFEYEFADYKWWLRFGPIRPFIKKPVKPTWLTEEYANFR